MKIALTDFAMRLWDDSEGRVKLIGITPDGLVAR